MVDTIETLRAERDALRERVKSIARLEDACASADVKAVARAVALRVLKEDLHAANEALRVLREAADRAQTAQCDEHAGASCRAWCDKCQAEVAADHALTSAIAAPQSVEAPAPAAPPQPEAHRRVPSCDPYTGEAQHNEPGSLDSWPPAPPADRAEPKREVAARPSELPILDGPDTAECKHGVPADYGCAACGEIHLAAAAAAAKRDASEPGSAAAPFDMVSFFDIKATWSRETFGPADRYAGVVAHIRKELDEILAQPDDLEEWVDVALLAMDGAWRSAGADGARFVEALVAKDTKNRTRTWPDWRTLAPDTVSEHVKGASAPDAEKRDVVAEIVAMLRKRSELGMQGAREERDDIEGSQTRARMIEAEAGTHRRLADEIEKRWDTPAERDGKDGGR